MNKLTNGRLKAKLKEQNGDPSLDVVLGIAIAVIIVVLVVGILRVAVPGLVESAIDKIQSIWE